MIDLFIFVNVFRLQALHTAQECSSTVSVQGCARLDWIINTVWRAHFSTQLCELKFISSTCLQHDCHSNTLNLITAGAVETWEIHDNRVINVGAVQRVIQHLYHQLRICIKEQLAKPVLKEICPLTDRFKKWIVQAFDRQIQVLHDFECIFFFKWAN